MAQKRYKDQIVSQILATCQEEGACKTKIVYASNLNFNTVKPYLDLLVKRDLLEIIENSPALYRTTTRGMVALKHLKVIEGLIN